MTNKLIVFSAPSGAGKTTLVKYILKTFREIQFSISATSRKARGEEKDGKDYYFLSNEEFKARIKNDEFIEYEEVYGGN
jgi:guanylate kinase